MAELCGTIPGGSTRRAGRPIVDIDGHSTVRGTRTSIAILSCSFVLYRPSQNTKNHAVADSLPQVGYMRFNPGHDRVIAHRRSELHFIRPVIAPTPSLMSGQTKSGANIRPTNVSPYPSRACAGHNASFHRNRPAMAKTFISDTVLQHTTGRNPYNNINKQNSQYSLLSRRTHLYGRFRFQPFVFNVLTTIIETMLLLLFERNHFKDTQTDETCDVLNDSK